MMEGLPLSSAEAEALDDDLCISGDKPFFDIILSKSHVTPPYSLVLAPFLFTYYFSSSAYSFVVCIEQP